MSAENQPQNKYVITRPTIFPACKNCPLFEQAASESPEKSPITDILDIVTLDENHNPQIISVRPITITQQPIAVSCRLNKRWRSNKVTMTRSYELLIVEGQLYNPNTKEYISSVSKQFPNGLLIPQTYMTQTKLSSTECPGLKDKK